MATTRFALSSTDRRPIYLQLMDEIRRAIVTGVLKSDDALPSLRELAVDLRINPNTIAQAYRELEREGLVYFRRGQGTFVADSKPTAADRKALCRRVAKQALLEAHRCGISAGELVDAIHEIDAAAKPMASGKRGA